MRWLGAALAVLILSGPAAAGDDWTEHGVRHCPNGTRAVLHDRFKGTATLTIRGRSHEFHHPHWAEADLMAPVDAEYNPWIVWWHGKTFLTSGPAWATCYHGELPA